MTVIYKTWSEASSQQEFAFQQYEAAPSLGVVGRFSVSLATFFSVDLLPISSLMVSGGRPSFFLHCLSTGFGALVGFVWPIAVAFTFHGSATPYHINAPSGN